MNVFDRERYSMLDKKEQKVFDDIHEYVFDSIDFRQLWIDHICPKNVPKMPDLGDFTTLFETILEEYESSQEELENEKDRADIAVDKHESILEESDKYHAALCDIEDCDNMGQVKKILQRVLYK